MLPPWFPVANCESQCSNQISTLHAFQDETLWQKYHHKIRTIILPKNERNCLGVAKNQNDQIMTSKIWGKLTIVCHINAEKYELEVGLRWLGVHARLRQGCCAVYICSLRVHVHALNSHVSTKLCEMFDQKTSYFAW